MKLHLVDRRSFNNSSFSAKIDECPYFLKIWHYHQELELSVILKSEGTLFIGDNVENFQPRDVVLIGKNLPHTWLNDDIYFKKKSNWVAKAITIHFRQDFLGHPFFENREMLHLLELFERASFGIKFLKIKNQFIKEISEMLEMDDFDKTIAFLNILNKLSKHKNYKLLSSQGYINAFQMSKKTPLENVNDFVFRNFKKNISLKDVSKIANMNTSAFSRFFKRINRKTFTKYLSEIRIGHACKLLIENKHNIATICYESGFQNLSNFNRQFKLIMKCTPSNYIKVYKNLRENSL